MFKFLHIADLHLGKTLHDISLVSYDQPFWIERFLEVMDQEDPDAVVIAGDVYDTRDPGQEAILLFDHLLTELARRGKYVFIIPGNHDSHIRLSVGARLYEDKKIFIARNVEAKIMQVTTETETPVTFWLLPYVFRKTMSAVLDRPDIATYDEALSLLMDEQKVDPSRINVLVAHQNVIASSEEKPEVSGSESVIIGGVGEVMSSRFSAFDYVALGHIHNAQAVGRETVRYAGCPMYYDFSEIKRKKPITVVTIDDRMVKNKQEGGITIREREIFLPHYLFQDRGSYEELKARGPRFHQMLDEENAELKKQGCPFEKKYYIKLLVEGDIPPGGQDILKHIYGEGLILIKPVREHLDTRPDTPQETDLSEMTILDQFEQMYRQMDPRGRDLDPVQRKILNKILELQEASGFYYDNEKTRPDDAACDELLEAVEEFLNENPGEEE